METGAKGKGSRGVIFAGRAIRRTATSRRPQSGKIAAANAVSNREYLRGLATLRRLTAGQAIKFGMALNKQADPDYP